MTVGELIAALQSYDPVDQVMLYDYIECDYFDVNEVYPRLGVVVLSN